MDLRRTNLLGADLQGADLSGADLQGADLSRMDLQNTDLSGMDLRDADLSGIDLQGADLSEANLRGADLSDANLRGADLSDANLQETIFDNKVSVDGATTCRRLFEGDSEKGIIARSVVPTYFGRHLFTSSDFGAGDWDATARAYHNLKTIFDAHGLIGKARSMHIRERRARSLEAKADNGWGDRRYLGSLPSRVFTGYGVGVLTLGTWMIALFLTSTALYVVGDVRLGIVNTLSFSVLAFTVAPPTPLPSNPWIQIVMMIETFFGTLSIVLMGYILGNREQF
jgi:hypothetical protein